ncbi:hypothetical protein PR003_g34718, partial [Phytophthora rubi]
LYRSCGTCGNKSRKVSVKNVYAVNGKVSLVTVNKNWGDQATITTKHLHKAVRAARYARRTYAYVMVLVEYLQSDPDGPAPSSLGSPDVEPCDHAQTSTFLPLILIFSIL